MKVHAEIEYKDVHSDLCPDGCDFHNIDMEHRKLLHAALDEWLDKSKGRGGFYIMEEGFDFQAN